MQESDQEECALPHNLLHQITANPEVVGTILSTKTQTMMRPVILELRTNTTMQNK